MIPFKVFGGEGSNLGAVRQLPPLNWADFTKETLGHPVPVSFTRAEFQALPKDSKALAKRVAYITPAIFKTPNAHRLHENATAFTIVAIDIDVDKKGNAPAAPFVKDPSQLHIALEPFNFAAYTTASSTPDKPRLRIFVQAASLPLSVYGDAVKTIAKRLGLPMDFSGIKESQVVVQPMYLPTIFRDEDIEHDHPLIAAFWDGQAMGLEDVGQQFEVVLPGERKVTSFNVDGDDLDYLRPVVEAVEVADAKDALEQLDPDMVYNEWLEVAAALRHQFPNEPEASQAYELFDEWSSKGDKYAGPDDTEAKWKSLRPSPSKRVPITIRTLLHKAQENGWDSLKLSSKCYGNTLKWMLDDGREGNQLMSEGIKRIAATPLLSPLERGTLLSCLQESMRAKGLKILRSELKKELTKIERMSIKREELKATPDVQLPPWARGICYVGAANEFYQRAANRRMKPEVLSNQFNYNLYGEEANGKPLMEAKDFLLNVVRIPRVDNYRYDPAHPEMNFLMDGKQKFINTYLPSYPEPNIITADSAGDIFMEHMANLFDEDEYARIIIDWCAFQVQFPGVKIRWAPLIQSAEGAGKTYIAAAMSAVLGKTNFNSIQGNLILDDKYNGWAMGAQLCAVEEIRAVGHNRYEVMNKLKPCITNDLITVRDMYSKPFLTPNNVNYILFTNFHDALAVGQNDRRYFVVYSAIQSKEQVLALGAEYFPRIYGMLRDDAAGLRSFFMEWKISDKFSPDGHAPVTKYLAELQKAAASPLNAAILAALEDEEHTLVRTDLMSSKALKGVLDTKAGLNKFTDQVLAGALRELDFVLLGRYRVDDDRHYLWTRRGGAVNEKNCADEARRRLEKEKSSFEDLTV